jgi:2-iminobutanoate/2-iminopropanoate deaminase
MMGATEMKKAVLTNKAPEPIGPYSQGIVASGKLLFVAGQGPKNPKTGVTPTDFTGQVAQCLENVKAIVEAGGAAMADVVKVNAFLKDLALFSAFNEVYARFFPQPCPARSTIGADLPGGIQVEVEAIAVLPK